MKKLSVVVVNYNVCHFLEQTLVSVHKAIKNIDTEIFVVDNNSADGSIEMVKKKFPDVILIENKDNVGFSRANNQAIHRAKGQYVLLLNPDTVVEENTFQACCDFMDTHPDAGGLGIKMLDGKGQFLPESKRSLPTPWVAFYKVFGLAALFPNSRKFGKYHLTYLDKDKTHQIEVLSGAYMFLRAETLAKTGLLDEDYFMYGEDIDLSYRILQQGYKNYYLPEARIIHYKGESTKRTSINYVFIFYRAMIIFAKKHFTNSNAGIFSFLIHVAIYLRAGLALFMRVINRIALPFIDASFIFIGMYFLKEYWEKNHKYMPGLYPPEYMRFVVPLYILVWLTTIYYNNGYSVNTKSYKIIRGAIIGTILISAISNFFDMYRFSKALILIGGIWVAFSMISTRLLIHFFEYGNLKLGEIKDKRIAIVGNEIESLRIIEILKESGFKFKILGFVSPEDKVSGNDLHLGYLPRINEITQIYDIDEIIFCSRDLPAHQIIEWMGKIKSKIVEFKIVPDDSNFIIGSNSKTNPGDFYTVNIELSILEKDNIKNKRLLDVSLSLFFLVLSPLIMWFTKSPRSFVSNIFQVLSGNYSWVGFSEDSKAGLPPIRKGIISPVSIFFETDLDSKTIRRLNFLYAKDYNLYTDLQLILKGFRKLGLNK